MGYLNINQLSLHIITYQFSDDKYMFTYQSMSIHKGYSIHTYCDRGWKRAPHHTKVCWKTLLASIGVVMDILCMGATVSWDKQVWAVVGPTNGGVCGLAAHIS